MCKEFKVCFSCEPCGGDHPHKCGCERYLNLYSAVSQSISPYEGSGDSIMLEAQNGLSSGDFDISAAATLGDITILKAGVYHLSWTVQARMTPPIPSPVPSFSFGFWLDGALVPGSVFSQFTQSPNDDATHVTGEVILAVKAGQKLRLRNTSVVPVSLDPNINGSVFPITVASVCIECLKGLI